MNKKVKSLLVAGLLVVGMNGNVFANESELPTTATSVIENPKFEDGKRVVELQGGLIVVELTEKEDGNIDIKVKWHDDSIKILEVKSHYINREDEADMGSINHTNYFETWYHCNTLVQDENGFVSGTVLGGIEGKDLSKVEITFENLTKGDEPVTPPEEPETPEENVNDPATGDNSIMAIVAVATVSAAGLYVVNRKKDEE